MPTPPETPPAAKHAQHVSARADFKLVNASFPRIGDKILLFWGEREFNRLMGELREDRRDGHRVGFPGDVMLALESLAYAHDVAFPQFARAETDFWSLSKAR